MFLVRKQCIIMGLFLWVRSLRLESIWGPSPFYLPFQVRLLRPCVIDNGRRSTLPKSWSLSGSKAMWCQLLNVVFCAPISWLHAHVFALLFFQAYRAVKSLGFLFIICYIHSTISSQVCEEGITFLTILGFPVCFFFSFLSIEVDD